MKKYQVSQEEIDYFREAMKTVRPLNTKTIIAEKPKKCLEKSQFMMEHVEELGVILPEVSATDVITYVKNGVDKRILRILKSHKITIEAELDLHGLTVPEAKKALNQFLDRCLKRQTRVVLIIHGKGAETGSILKNCVNRWLRTCPFIMAFASSLSSRGGALNVKLNAPP